MAVLFYSTQQLQHCFEYARLRVKIEDCTKILLCFVYDAAFILGARFNQNTAVTDKNAVRKISAFRALFR